MNMVSLLLLSVVMSFSLSGGTGSKVVGAILAIICIAAITWGVLQSKKETPGLTEE
jgi:hypothetical protein